MEIQRNDSPIRERVGSMVPLGSPSHPMTSSSKNIAPEESHNGDNMTACTKGS